MDKKPTVISNGIDRAGAGCIMLLFCLIDTNDEEHSWSLMVHLLLNSSL